MPKKSAVKAVAAKPEPVATAVAQDGSVDPTLLTSRVAVGGKEYTLCFDLGSLARAEHELRAAGHDVSLLHSLTATTLEDALVLFAAAIRRFHPEIPFEVGLQIPDVASILAVRRAIEDAWRRCLAKPSEDKKNPTQPGR